MEFKLATLIVKKSKKIGLPWSQNYANSPKNKIITVKIRTDIRPSYSLIGFHNLLVNGIFFP